MADTKPGRGYDHLPEHRRRIYQQDACHDFDDLLGQALADGKAHTLTAWPDGTPLLDEADAWRLLGKIANCKAGRACTVRRGQPDGLGPVQQADGTWAARFQVLPKDDGREHIAARLERGELLAFNPAAPRARGRYICIECHHRRAPQPRTRCADCAARLAAGDRMRDARRQAELQARRWGQGWDHPENWRADHALRQPRTPREQADRPTAEEARQHITLEARLRDRGGSQLPWEELRPRNIKPGIARRIRAAQQAARDQAEARQVRDERVREMLGRWKSGRWT